jgi:hypothetical protein
LEKGMKKSCYGIWERRRWNELKEERVALIRAVPFYFLNIYVVLKRPQLGSSLILRPRHERCQAIHKFFIGTTGLANKLRYRG